MQIVVANSPLAASLSGFSTTIPGRSLMGLAVAAQDAILTGTDPAATRKIGGCRGWVQRLGSLSAHLNL
jgi:hypothetical protein